MSATAQPPVAASLFIKDPSQLDDDSVEHIVHWLRYEAVRLARSDHEEGDYTAEIFLEDDTCPMN